MSEPMIFHLEKYDKMVLICCPNGCHATPVPSDLIKKAKRYTHARVAEVPGGIEIQFIKEHDGKPGLRNPNSFPPEGP